MIYIRKATLCINSTKQTREIQEGKKKTGKIKKNKNKKENQTTKELQKRKRAKKRG